MMIFINCTPRNIIGMTNQRSS